MRFCNVDGMLNTICPHVLPSMHTSPPQYPQGGGRFITNVDVIEQQSAGVLSDVSPLDRLGVRRTNVSILILGSQCMTCNHLPTRYTVSVLV